MTNPPEGHRETSTEAVLAHTHSPTHTHHQDKAKSDAKVGNGSGRLRPFGNVEVNKVEHAIYSITYVQIMSENIYAQNSKLIGLINLSIFHSTTFEMFHLIIKYSSLI